MKSAYRLILRAGIVLALALLLAHAGLSIASRVALRNAYAALRDAGLPMDAKNLIPPEVPIDDNASPLYESAIALMESEEWDGTILLTAAYRISSDFMAPASASPADMDMLLENDVVRRALALAERAADRPQCRFDLQYDMGLDLSLAHQHKLLMLTHLLAARAVHEARQDNGDDALRTLHSALQTSHALRTEPFVYSSVFRNQQVAVSLRALQEILTRTTVTDDTLADLSTLLPSPEDIRDHFLLALNGDRLLFKENGWIKIGSDSFPPDLHWRDRFIFAFFAFPSVLRANHAIYLREMDRITRETARPYWEHPAPAANVFDPKSSGLSWCSLLALVATDIVPPHRKTMATAQANVQVARAALALLRHKLAHGAYPASLAEIDPAFLPEVPLDPFTGNPLVYRPDGDGFLLYSLGENLADDGGTEKSQDNSKSKAFDIVWHLPR